MPKSHEIAKLEETISRVRISKYPISRQIKKVQVVLYCMRRRSFEFETFSIIVDSGPKKIKNFEKNIHSIFLDYTTY